MPKMICVKDQIELRCHKNGVYLVETFQADSRPYRIWASDLYKCPGCGAEIISGFSGQGVNPIIEHFDPGFMEVFQEIVTSKKPLYYSHERIR